MLKKEIKLTHFVLVMSTLNFVLFHFPFFRFVFNSVDYTSFNGILLVISLLVLMVVLNAFVFYLIFYLSVVFGRVLLTLFFVVNALAVYFVVTYGVIIDETMIGNVLNTSYDESSSFLSFRLVLYIVLLGILPSVYIFRVKIVKGALKPFLLISSLTLLFIALLVFVNASNWLWIDKNSKRLGGLAMPWSYTVNLQLFYIHKSQKNEKEILLPDARIRDTEKSVVVLVIGESARSQNFSLYGYPRNTNPLLSKEPGVHHFNATSCATYTTAGVKCILEHTDSGKLYEILPNYLYRNDVEVVWRTSNWGEPPVHIKNYQKSEDLRSGCTDDGCHHDEVLLKGLKQLILSSKKNKILIVLHTSISHGPTYNKKYPSRFEVFKPVCSSVELGNCSNQSLINAYDNTIVYTDYVLHQAIEDLKQLKAYKSALIFVSDHGESLGEKNLYMHGLPMSIAPKEQYEIPFIVWTSPGSDKVKSFETVNQNYVFHSVLHFLNIESPVYEEDLNIFE
ncbi:phosphoethanolamine--lipid A transferase EptA [Flavobacterium sp. HJ-32-4]|uniref:phosphoethanolamine--lipid A transferase EptA n=1 Tax=unclassified Flavobacterium TaxID=196869 RepID=UPI003530083B